MTVESSYFARVATGGLPVAADPGQDGTSAEAQSVAITATPVPSAATPDGQTALSLIGTEAFRFEYSQAGAVTAVANSNYVAAGERMCITAAVAVIGAIAAYLTGDASLVETAQLVVTAVLGATIRHGVATGV